MEIKTKEEHFKAHASTLTLRLQPSKVNMAMKRRGSFFRTLKNVEPDFDDVILDRGISAAAQNKWVFEIAWEVANKGLCCP